MNDSTIISPQLWREIKQAERGLNGGSTQLIVELCLDRGADPGTIGLAGVGTYKTKGKGLVFLSAQPAEAINLAALGQIKSIGLAPDTAKVRWAVIGRIAGLVLVAGLAVVMIGPFGQLETPTPPNVDANKLYEQGLQAYDQGNRIQAVDLWRKALDQKPDLRGLRLSLAWLYYELGRTGDALEQVLTLLKRNPDDREAQAALDVIQKKAGPKVESDR